MYVCERMCACVYTKYNTEIKYIHVCIIYIYIYIHIQSEGHLKYYKLLFLKVHVIVKNVSDKSYLTRRGTKKVPLATLYNRLKVT